MRARAPIGLPTAPLETHPSRGEGALPAAPTSRLPPARCSRSLVLSGNQADCRSRVPLALPSRYNLAARVERIPAHCFWEITEACNLRCIHCEAEAGRADRGELSTEEALSLVDELAQAGCQHVCLTGGEPLVRRDWPVIARELRARDVEVTVITNGVLVDASVLAVMVEVGVGGISVSLDGRQEVHDAIRLPAEPHLGSIHDRALRAIELAHAAGLKVAVITQVHRHNLDDLAEMYELLARLQADAWQVQLCMPLGRLLRCKDDYLLEPSQLPVLLDLLEGFVRQARVPILVADNIGYYGRSEAILRGSSRGSESFWAGCLAGCRVVAIRSNGDVKGCPSHPVEFVAGNVRTTPFSVLWSERERFAYNTAFREDLLEGGCAQCEYRRICRAGCTSMAYAVTGTIYNNPFCVQQVAGGAAAQHRDDRRCLLGDPPEGEG